MKLGLDPPYGRNRTETSVLKKTRFVERLHILQKSRLGSGNPRAQGKEKVFLPGLSSQWEKN